ncbi:MAG: universal stress protein [Halolamina sp.]
MDHALAVVGPDETTKRLVHEAGQLAAGVDADLTLLHVTSETEYEEAREEMENLVGLDVTYSVTQALQGARSFADDIGREVLADIDVEYETAGALGDRAETIVREAEDRGCDYVFVTGEERSPTGKALFGDETQQVILNFEGVVSVVTS